MSHEKESCGQILTRVPLNNRYPFWEPWSMETRTKTCGFLVVWFLTRRSETTALGRGCTWRCNKKRPEEPNRLSRGAGHGQHGVLAEEGRRFFPVSTGTPAKRSALRRSNARSQVARELEVKEKAMCRDETSDVLPGDGARKFKSATRSTRGKALPAVLKLFQVMSFSMEGEKSKNTWQVQVESG